MELAIIAGAGLLIWLLKDNKKDKIDESVNEKDTNEQKKDDSIKKNEKKTHNDAILKTITQKVKIPLIVEKMPTIVEEKIDKPMQIPDAVLNKLDDKIDKEPVIDEDKEIPIITENQLITH